MVTEDDNVSRLMAGERSLRETNMIREGVVRTARNIAAKVNDQHQKLKKMRRKLVRSS